MSIDSQRLFAALNEGLKVTGTLRQESVTENTGWNRGTYRRWNAGVTLQNGSGQPLSLGSDLFLIEVSGDSDKYEGFSVFGRAPVVVGPMSYGLVSNYEEAGRRINQGSDGIAISLDGWKGESFGAVGPRAAWDLKREFPEYTWLRSPAVVFLVLPEIRLETKEGVERFRLLAYFQEAQQSKPWTFREQKLVRLDTATLGSMVKAPDLNLPTRVLAANWLAERQAKDAAAPLAAAAKPLREGQLLASCLLLLTNLKGPGLEAHALDLLQDRQAPKGIRWKAAEYLGAVRHAPAGKALIAATDDPDKAVRAAAVHGLGQLGGARAAQVLAGLLRDPRFEDKVKVAESLARTGEAEALRLLQDEVGKGNAAALHGLAEAGLPETFPFFARLAERAPPREQQDVIARGLKNSGGAKALDLLLAMLEQTGPDEAKRAEYRGEVRALAELDRPEATARLTKLSAAGNIAAAHVLAQSKNGTVQAPLTELARTGSGPVRVVAVKGLADHWAGKSVDVFATALADADKEVAQAAVSGLAQSKDPRATGLLVPVLGHVEAEVRDEAASALRELPAGDQVPRLVDALMRSQDRSVITACAEVILKTPWQDQTLARRLGEKLQATREGSGDYELVRLLQRLSGDVMGPKDKDEWSQDRPGWRRKWVEWASRQ